MVIVYWLELKVNMLKYGSNLLIYRQFSNRVGKLL